jgi:hypothetical protein
MKAKVILEFSEEEVNELMNQLSTLYDIAYPKIKDWVDSQEAKKIKSKYWAITRLITELSMLRIDLQEKEVK